MNWNNKTVILAMIFCLSLVGCGGGGGSNGNPGAGSQPVTLSGVAAAGAPIAGIVNVKGANGATASSPVGSDGTYSLDVTDLTAPYILFAEGTVNGKSIKIFSAGVAAGTINITPITDFILRNAVAGSAEAAFDNWITTQVSATALTTAEAGAQAQLTPLLNAAGVSADVDLFTTPFSADHTGLDAVLDSITISYNGDIATVTNNATGESFTDNITLTGDSQGFQGSGNLSDAEAINAFWKSLGDLFATQPSNMEISNWVNSHLANDFLDEGFNKTELHDDWITDESPEVGETFSAVIVAPLDVSATSHTKGYSVRVSVSSHFGSGSFMTFMAFDGTKWLWFGDQRWLDVDAEAAAIMRVNNIGTLFFSTGLELEMEDETNLAFDRGARSAFVTGPGLPVGGVVFKHQFPDPSFHLFIPSGLGGAFFVISDDNLISAIPDNAEYTFTLCSDEAEDLVSDGTDTCTVLQAYSETIMKRPLLNSELNASRFPSVTEPTTHSISDLNFGGEINVSWVNPVNTIPEGVTLFWSVLSSEIALDVESEPGDTSAVIDTTGLPEPTGSAILFINVQDAFERTFNTWWSLTRNN